MSGLTFACVFLGSLGNLHQAQASESSSGYWIGIMPIYNITDKHSLMLQAEARKQGEDSFYLFRPSYQYQALAWISVGVGGDIFTFDTLEARYWAEFNLRAPQLYLSQRFHLRARQEFRELPDSNQTGARTRVMFMSQFDISKPHGLEIFVFDEVFYSQRTFSGSKNAYDRNWLGFRIRKNYGNMFVDAGYFWEKLFGDIDVEGNVGILSLGYVF